MSRKGSSRELALALFVVGAVVLAAHAAGIVLCSLRRFTGIPCPGCGSTRAAMLVLRGEFAAAVALNPLAVALFALVPAWWLFLRRRTWSRGAKAAFLVVALVAVALNWAWILFCYFADRCYFADGCAP